MAIIAQRHAGYKAGLLLCFCGLVVFIAGLATPFWYIITYTSSTSASKAHVGLWVACFKLYFGESNCVDLSQFRSGGWEHAVKGLESASLALMIISLFYAIYANFVAITVSYPKLLEIGLGFAGGLGLGGAVTYAVKMMQEVDFTLNLDSFNFTLSWSFALAITGSVLVIIGDVFIAIFNKPLQQQQQQQQKHLPTTGFSNLGYIAPMYATPGMVAYSTPPPAYNAGLNVCQVQGVGQGKAMGQVQGQTLVPMVFDSPV